MAISVSVGVANGIASRRTSLRESTAHREPTIARRIGPLTTRDSAPITSASLYPEVGAGGFTSVDGIIEFYGRVNALLDPEMVLLDFGAGRGKDAVEDRVEYRRALRVLKGKVRLVVGVDVDPIVGSNPSLDSAILIAESGNIPLASNSVDIVISDFTFEHVNHPATVTAELTRVLKSGGWLCARTPNRSGYIALGARIIPNRFHTVVLRRLQPERKPRDVFPTAYKLNTPHQAAKYFPPEDYSDYSYYYDSEPAYFGSGSTANRFARAAFRLLPTRYFAVLMIFKRKK